MPTWISKALRLAKVLHTGNVGPAFDCNDYLPDAWGYLQKDTFIGFVTRHIWFL